MDRLTQAYNPWETAGAIPDDGRGDNILPGSPGYDSPPPADAGTGASAPSPTAGATPLQPPFEQAGGAVLAPPFRPIGQTGSKVPGTVAVSIQSVANDMHDVDMSVPVAGVVIASANPNRRYLLIQNKDAANPVFVRMGVSLANGGTKIIAGGNYELEINVPVCYIFAYATGAAVTVNVVEGSVQGN